MIYFRLVWVVCSCLTVRSSLIGSSGYGPFHRHCPKPMSQGQTIPAPGDRLTGSDDLTACLPARTPDRPTDGGDEKEPGGPGEVPVPRLILDHTCGVPLTLYLAVLK